MAKYLSTQYPNNKPANQRGGNTGGKKNGDQSKTEDKDSITGNTAGAHVEDTTTTEESTPPSGKAIIGFHVSETNEHLLNSLRTVEEILGTYPVDNDNFWGNTNPTDVSINTVNSKETMGGSHIIKFHTSKYDCD